MTNKLPRRDFFRRSVGAIGATASLTILPASIRKALAIEAKVITGSIKDVKHIVILMQENRSFNHYFGTLRGVRGFGDRFPVPLESGKDVWWQSDGKREITPYHLDSETMRGLLVPTTPHKFPDSQAAWNQGKFGYWPKYKTEFSMGYYKRKDIPFQFALAEAFTICDAYHCSIITGTHANRITFWSGSNYNPDLGRSGVNCTDKDSQANNFRLKVSGTMPSPGYTYRGSSFLWKTIPDILEEAGVSWRIYQNPNDNWTGELHGCLAFESFRKATATSGSPLYEKGMTNSSIADLKKHVKDGTLPEVSWILPNKIMSEHATAGCSPTKAGSYVNTILDALTSNPEVWSKTAFFYNFDENDGLFDHVPPPAVPSYNADGTLAGKSTISVEGEYFFDEEKKYIFDDDTISGSVRPWGLSARVPMYVVSPWSKGGWVNSQVFDHTSVAMFLEKRFDIKVDAISPWHRAVCGDLTTCFDFVSPNDISFPSMPDVSNYAAIEAHQKTLSNPLPPDTPSALFQEQGTRFSRALPYELQCSAHIDSSGKVRLEFVNTGSQGAVFHVYDKKHLNRIPRRYTVEGRKSISDVWDPITTDGGYYELCVYSTNGFIRFFNGNSKNHAASTFQPEIQVGYERVNGDVYLNVFNRGSQAGEVKINSNAYRKDGPWILTVPESGSARMNWSLADSGRWYDFTVSAPGFERRLSGRVENGKHSVSDPYMALHLK